MVTRIWHGRTKKEDAEMYRHYVVETGIREYLKTEGNLDVRLLQRDEGDVTHIWTVTLWQELECIRAFAGDDINRAKYFPDDDRYLLELEPDVIHCRTFLFSRLRIENYIRQLGQLYEGGSWNDECFMDKLKTVDDKRALLQPIPGKHCIAELVWHCTYWRTVLSRFLQGDNGFRERTIEDQNFLSRESLQQKGWTSVLSDFKESQTCLIALLSTKHDDFLEEEFREGKTFDYIIEGVIHHDLYHLGQIGLVISMLNSAKRG